MRNYLARMQLGAHLDGLDIRHDLGVVTSHDVGHQLCELRRFDSEDELEEVAETIVRLYRDAGWGVVQTLYSCLFELAVNAVQHSGQGGGFVALQSYPKTEDVAFAVGDSGVGLRSRLGSATDQAAIGKAARKYATSKSEPGRGRGITEVIELTGKNHGAMTMVSGTAYGEFVGGNWDPRVTVTDNPFLGTVAQARLRRQVGD
ncbi:sensor histidine kinase [Allobranchiibius sp. GilTou38]|uniref:sensor histidine kinase n=1 Tax=Allobranchiibius sp. GilTou38 TaxID=2815210 RepID=UPI001AA113D7|nr:sensor histidine kinase [Allobranchiibius sp. GilTou38]MBO1767063.1 sensor histidine kinase [Allobranchiibius sp. GilTou38]